MAVAGPRSTLAELMTRPQRLPSPLLLSCSLALAFSAGCGDDDDSPAEATSAATTGPGSSSGEPATTALGSTTEPATSTSTATSEPDPTSGSDTGLETGTGCDTEGCDGILIVPLPGTDLFPEGIAADEAGTLFVGSLTSSTIFSVVPPYASADVSVFSEGQLSRGGIGLAVDTAHGVLLACDSAPTDPTASSLVALDLESGQRVAEHPLEPVSPRASVFCNDVTVDGSGDALLTDSFGARLLRIAAEDITSDGTPPELWFADEALAAVGEPPFGPNGIVEHDSEIYVVNFDVGALFRVDRDGDGNAVGATEIVLSDADGATTSLVGPDGLASSDAGGLLVVENGVFAGGAGNRLLELAIQDDTAVVTVLAEDLDAPTTVAETDDFHWVVQGQLEHLFGIDETPPGPFELWGVPR